MDKADKVLEDLRNRLDDTEAKRKKGAAKLFRLMVGLFGGNCTAKDSLISEMIPL